MNQPCVYILTNKPNGAMYIGVTSNVASTRVWHESHDRVWRAPLYVTKRSQGMESEVGSRILTQAAAWTNVERAIAAGMKQAIELLVYPRADPRHARRRPGPRHHCSSPEAEYFNAKAQRQAQGLCPARGVDGYDGDLQAFLSRELGPHGGEENVMLSIYGIGPETADDILVYAAEKPSFVIDSYTRQSHLVQRLDLFPGWTDKIQLPGLPGPVSRLIIATEAVPERPQRPSPYAMAQVLGQLPPQWRRTGYLRQRNRVLPATISCTPWA